MKTGIELTRNDTGYVAVLDGSGINADVGLYFEKSDGEVLGPLPWPEGWPPRPTLAFLEKSGVRIVRV